MSSGIARYCEAMSRDSVEAAKQWTEAYNRRDYATLEELIDPDFEMKSVFASLDSGGVFRAPDGFPGAYFESLHAAYESFQVIPHRWIDGGAAVLAVANAEWKGKGSGVKGHTPIWVVWWLRAGKVFREETFSEEAPAFEAAGLRR